MKFAENNKISHRQLYRQMVLAFLAPFLLCLFPNGKRLGLSGIAGTAAALLALFFYVIFLIRIASYYEHMKKYAGSVGELLICLFYTAYILLTGAFLLKLLGKIVPMSVLEGVSGALVSLLAAVVCSGGIHRGMQKRGRMAEVSGGLLLLAVALMMGLSLGQAKLSYFREMMVNSRLSVSGFLENGYGILCAFSGLGLLPFLLREVEHSRESVKAAAAGVLTLGGILLGMELLLPAVFGWDRLLTEKYPLLPLLAGANLPGNVLARFDVLWMAFLIYSLLFSLGSLLHYGHQVVSHIGVGSGRWWMAAVMYGFSLVEFDGVGIEEYYGIYLGVIFVPGLLLLQLFLMLRGRGRGKKKAAAAAGIVLMMGATLSGCAGVDPEKRLYPQAVGVELVKDEGFQMFYGMADLPKATGQEKTGEESNKGILEITGRDFREIEEIYGRSQEKFLDMGHLEVLILGQSLLENKKWEPVLAYLEQDPYVGEDVYVFRAENAGEAVAWKNARGSSVGDYLVEMIENPNSVSQGRTVTLREVYYTWKKENTLPRLPEVALEGKELQVLV